MGWLTVAEYAKLKDITDVAVYKQIKNDKLTTKKGEQNKTLIYTNIDEIIHPKQELITPSINGINKTDSFIELEEFREFLTSLVDEIKKSKDNEINTLKNSYERIIEMKDSREKEQSEEINKLKNEIDGLKEELKKSNSGLFKRLFG